MSNSNFSIGYNNPNPYGYSPVETPQQPQLGSVDDQNFWEACSQKFDINQQCYLAWKFSWGNHNLAKGACNDDNSLFHQTFTTEDYQKFEQFHESYVQLNSSPNYNSPTYIPNNTNNQLPPYNNNPTFHDVQTTNWHYSTRHCEAKSVLNLKGQYFSFNMGHEIYTRISTIADFQLKQTPQKPASDDSQNSNSNSNNGGGGTGRFNFNYAPTNIGSHNSINSHNSHVSTYGKTSSEEDEDDKKKKKNEGLGWLLGAVAGVALWFVWKEQQDNKGKAKTWLTGTCMKEVDIQNLVKNTDFLDNIQLKDRVVELLRKPQEIVDQAESVLLQRLTYKVATIAALILGAVGGIFTVEAALALGVIFASIGAVVWIVDALSRDSYAKIVEKAFDDLKIEANTVMETEWQYTGLYEGQSQLWKMVSAK